MRRRRAPAVWSRHVQLLERHSRRPEVLLGVVELHLAADRPRRGLGVLALLLRAAPQQGDDPRFCALAGRCYHGLGRSKQALRYLERTLARLPVAALTPPARKLDARAKQRQRQKDVTGRRPPRPSAAYGRRPSSCSCGSRSSAGLPAGARAAEREIASCADDELRASLCKAWEWPLATWETSRRLASSSLARPSSTRSPVGHERMRSLSYLAILGVSARSRRSAIERYRAAVELAERHHLTPLLPSALLNLGTACQRQGEWGAALDHYGAPSGWRLR